MNILVTGTNGQLGNEMRIISKESTDKYIFTDVNQIEGLETTYLDITDLDAIRTIVKENNVQTIVNCAAWTNVDGAEDPEKYTAYFIKIDGVKFRKKVVPGDTLVFKVNLLGPVRHGISTLHGYAFVGDDLVCEATYACQIIKTEE